MAGKRRSVRADLLRAAMELFAVGGSRGTSLAAIADKIGVTTPSITHHFGTKEALLLEIVAELDRSDMAVPRNAVTTDHFIADVRRWAISLRSDPAWTNLIRLRAVMVAEALDPSCPAHAHFVARHRLVRHDLAGVVERGQLEGVIRGEIDPLLLAGEIAGFCQGVQIQWLLDPDEFPIADVVDAYLERLLSDLTPAARHPSL